MIYLQGLALITLIALWSQSHSAKTMIARALGGIIGVALIVAVMAFTNELSRNHLNSEQFSSDYLYEFRSE